MNLKPKTILLLISVLLLFFICIFSSACHPNIVIHVTNNTSETLLVFVVYNPPSNGLEEMVGEVAPNSTIYKDLQRNMVAFTYITVKAKNEQDVIVFSHKYENREFVDIGMKVIITPSQ